MKKIFPLLLFFSLSSSSAGKPDLKGDGDEKVVKQATDWMSFSKGVGTALGAGLLYSLGKKIYWRSSFGLEGKIKLLAKKAAKFEADCALFTYKYNEKEKKKEKEEQAESTKSDDSELSYQALIFAAQDEFDKAKEPQEENEKQE